MNYPFYCSNDKCKDFNIVKEISMPMSEYTDKVFCDTCGEKMERTLSSLVCSYKNTEGFFGKATQHD